MIPKETELNVIRLHHAEKWPPGTIARQLGLHHNTVERVLRDAGLREAVVVSRRRSMADPFVPFITETLTKYPTICASRLYAMVRERGYAGGPDHFRAIIARHRPKPAAEAFQRLRTLPGEQAQVDWAHFGTVEIDGGKRPLVAFVMVLSWSRHLYVEFGYDMRMGAFLRAHQAAFDTFAGIPRVLLYDNLKSAVIERQGDAIRFNETLLAFAAHNRYEPRPVAPYRGNEKGRVERAIRYVRDAFFTARTWSSLDDLNAQARAWCLDVAGTRRSPEDRSRTVQALFDEEKPRLMVLPDDVFPALDRVDATVGKTPYVRFDGNDYTVPHDRVRRVVTVVADAANVRVLDGNEEIACHARSWGKGKQIEDAAHLAALVMRKREARESRGMDRLQNAAPSSRSFLVAIAERGGNLGAHTIGLIKLLDAYGAEAVETAIAEALAHNTLHLHAIRQIVDRRRHAEGRPPPIPVALPDDPRVRDVVVKPHRLNTYDNLTDEDDHE